MAEIDKTNEFFAADGFRWLLQKLKVTFRKIGSIIPVSEGGTGADNASDARANLGISEFRGVSGSIQSVSGLLPGAPIGGENKVFYGRGEWGDIQGVGGHDDLIAPVESASGSEHAYAIGNQFIIEGILYIATAAIAVGDAFVVGTNCAINQNITDQIKAIVDSYVTGIKGNAETDYRTGNVNLTPANIGAVPLVTNAGIGTVSGAGRYSWCKIATLTITEAYVNGPIAFEISQRQEPVSLVQVGFESSRGTDPDLSYFTTNYSARYYIKKESTSVWCLYAAYTETWGLVSLHRITGKSCNNGVTITVLLENCAAPSSPTQVSYGGNVGYATSANSSSSADNAAKLNGYASDTAASKNTIVRRNSSGYVYAVYYNQSSSEETSATNARPCIIDGSGWHRKFGIAAFRNLIGLGNTTSYLPIANGGTGTNALTTAIKAVRYTITAKTVYNNHGYNLSSTTNSNMPSGYTFLCYLAIASDGFVYSGIYISLPNDKFGGIYADNYSALNNNGKIGITFLCVKT